MSRAFTRESELPVALPERPLSRYPNYVTARGLAQLREQLAAAESERARLLAASDRAADAAALAAVERDQRWLQARLATAIAVDVAAQPRDRVAFGATVRAEDDAGGTHCYAIVGEDEADVEQERVSWRSPLAQALMGARSGDEVVWRRPAGDLRLTVQTIAYPD
ncbi:MAG: GreA/GreB family elongation factor [Xanthomonadaceae bacterium]|nr:GreA/GreB family elongation factor [Xanthomonadaceae bacterium]MDE1958702.1 GreA/GreB family elongation factor [Xanthomonadaceae bacterium]MDE2177264.1 GreA/GreB family elongation factor [Xanthomonadaceae bacterium]MDE2245686.1 GreA/GreB family elongation factor [Xanthomonadaceae bacterium]